MDFEKFCTFQIYISFKFNINLIIKVFLKEKKKRAKQQPSAMLPVKDGPLMIF